MAEHSKPKPKDGTEEEPMIRLQAILVPSHLVDDLHGLLGDLKEDSPALTLRFADALRYALVRGVEVGRAELRKKRQALASDPELTSTKQGETMLVKAPEKRRRRVPAKGKRS